MARMQYIRNHFIVEIDMRLFRYRNEKLELIYKKIQRCTAKMRNMKISFDFISVY